MDAPLCAQIANLFLSRRNASFLQHCGIYQIPNVRWGDERTFTTIELPEAVAFVFYPCHKNVCPNQSHLIPEPNFLELPIL
ncbi:DUF4417 domain-containing protein [Fibrobacter intestinalis]|uniref:DUF4417 domain-containing protein n=1 Tax=Fibrobacter intestinalis TaxID=28122 RepID=UPI0023F112EC|nr:DUF4417 domain-containing protein [Fibrobacter intestinalis]MDD7298428.1 DUF4417 domain-containing protein [Fibrobacter intestinalis]